MKTARPSDGLFLFLSGRSRVLEIRENIRYNKLRTMTKNYCSVSEVEVNSMSDCDICFLGKHNVKNNVFLPHRHNCHEVVYFLRGKGTVCIGENEYSVYPHRYCIVPPDTEHVEHLADDGEILFIGFQADPDILADCGSVHTDKNITVLPRLESVLQEYRGQHIGYKTASEAFLRLFLVEHIRKNTKDNKDCSDLSYIKTYLEQYYGQRINFRELSALTGYSYDYFRHVFKNRYGVSPQEYLIDTRLENARKMLQCTTQSCTQIAASCGFSNSAQMTMMIKRKFYQTPMSLRKANSYKNTYDL